MKLINQNSFQYTPTFIYFDESGKEVWRTVGKLDVKKIRETLP